MNKYKKISLISAVGGSVLIANSAFPPYRNAWALSQDTADELKKKRAAMIPIIHYVLQGELASDDSYFVEQNTQLTVTAQQGIFANDEVGSTFNFLLLEDVQNGTLTLQPDGSFIYLPNPNFTGIDTFRYSLSIGGGLADEAIVTIKVNGLPVAIADHFELDGSTPFLGNVISNSVGGNDTIVDGAEVDAVNNVATNLGGSLSIESNGDFQYFPPINLGAQQDSYVYTLRDMDDETDTAMVTWQVPAQIIGIDQDETVIENNLLNAQLTFFTPGSVEYIEFNSSRFTLAQLMSASSGSPLIAADTLLGTLSVMGFNTTSGVLDYRYDPTGISLNHTSASNDTLREIVIIRLKDTARISAVTGNLNIDITDTDPVANNDQRSISEGTNEIAGNAVGTSGSATGDAQDTVIDSVSVTEVDFGATNGTVGTNLAGNYGSFVINSAGVYTYTLDNTNTDVQGLKGGQSVTEVFTYTITDIDGDTDSANVTITINGVEDALPTLTIPDDNAAASGDLSVSEENTVTGETITINADAGFDNASALIVTNESNVSRTLTLTELNSLSTTNIPITGAAGQLTLTDFNASTGVLTFNYDPTGTSTDHSSGEVLDQFSLVVQDNEGDTNSDSLDILIDDSIFAAVDDDASITEDAAPNTITGNNLLGNDTLGADTPTQISQLSFNSAVQTIGSTFNTQYGSFQLSNNGEYTYTLDNANSNVQALDAGQSLTEQFVYTLSDTDESETATLTITINGESEAPTITIPNDGAGTANSDLSVVENSTVNGSFTLNAVNGLNSTGTALALTDEDLDTLNLSFSQLQNLGAANQSLVSTDGNLILNGYSNAGDDHIISFSFDPTGTARDHSGGDNSIIEQYSLLATDDNSLNSVGKSLDIVISDTDPVANNDQRSMSEGTNAIAGNAVGTLGSATGDAQDTVIDSVSVTDIDFASTDGTVGTNLAGNYGSFVINSAGVYTYTLDNTNADVQGLKNGESITDVFTYTITDADGDTDSANVTVTINGVEDQPTISVTASNVTEENVSVGDVVATFASNDLDGDSLTNSLLNDPNGYFVINGTNVELTAAGVTAINNDALDLTSLTIEVQTDDGTSQISDSDSLGITRVNDNAPIISVTASSVTEESVSAGDVVATFSSSDPDGDSLTHSALNDPNGYFSISGTDVVLTQAGVDAINNDALDLTSLTVEIEADDGTFQSSDSDSVGITRVNDNAPIISVTASNVTEESVSVGDVVATFSSSDPDGDSLTHAVLNDPNGYFSISGTDVVLTQAGVDAINNDSLDLTSLTVEIQADDGTFQSSDSDSLGITRVNDNAPIISVTASSVTEESVSVGDVIATFSSSDPDGDSLTHSVLNDPNSYFSISGTDVVLTAAGVDAINNDALDLTSLTVEVEADDGTFQSSDSDSLGITRVNDNAPIISVTASSVTEESVSAGDVVASFASSDPDGDSLTHSVLNDPNSYFSISGTDVTLTAAGVDAINDDTLALSSLTIEVQADDGTFQSSDSDSLSITRVNDPLIITIPDNNSTATGDASVVENATLTAGQFSITAGAGLDSTEALTINSTSVSLSALQNSNSSNIVIPTTEGSLTLTGFTSATGVVTFNYDPSGVSKDHSGGEITDAIALTIKDNEGDTSSDSLDILITDTSPVANDDARSISEGTNAIAGNAVGTSGAATGDVQDTIIDTNLTPVTDIDFASTDGTVGTNLAGNYGSFVINSAGVYTYTLDNTNADVQGLKNGESIADVFTYTITDGDGSTDSANVTVTINGVEDAPPTIAIPDNNGGGVVGDSSVAENAMLSSGQFTLTATAGIASATLAGQDITNASAVPVTIVGSDGEFVVNGFNSSTGVASYRFDPTGNNRNHSAGDQSIVEQLTLLLIDNEGDSATDTLDILITDTAPTAAPDNSSIDEDGFSNTVTGDATTNDTSGADTAISVVGIDFGGAQTVGTPFASSYGSLDLNTDGTYTYTLDNGNGTVQALNSGQSLTEQFNYTITDTDGDTSTSSVTITVNGVTD